MDAARKWFTKEQLEGKSAPASRMEIKPPCRVFSGFLRGVDGSMVPPAARFLNEQEILEEKDGQLLFDEKLQAEQAKIFLGVFNARPEKMTHKPGLRTVGGVAIGLKDDRHIITVAGNRSGKGRSMLVPNLLTYPGSMLVIDPKGDLATFTARHRMKVMKQDVKVLDPFGVADVPDECRASFNPVQILSPNSNTLVEDAGRIADALVVSKSNDHDPHWDETAKHFIETLLLHIATSSLFKDSERTLLTLADKVGHALKVNEKEENILYAELLANGAEDGAIVRGARAFYDRHENELTSVLSTVRRHIHFLDYRQIRAVLGSEKSIDLRDLKRRPTTIYLTLPVSHMGTCARWLRLFVNLAINAAELEPVRAKNPHAVLLCLDEFAVLGYMKSLEDAVGQMAGFNLRLWPVLQDLGQLKSLYSERWESFLGNAGIAQFFGNSDNFTLEWISKRLGKTRAFNSSERERTWSGEMNQETANRTGEVSHPLLSPDEVARFFGREDPEMRQLIIRPTFAPLVLQRVLYDEYPMFEGKFYDRKKHV